MAMQQGYKDAIIKLDSPRCVFYPGQVITGTLELELESPLTFSVIYIKFIGEAIVNWTEQESETVNGNKRYKNVEYNSREEYLRGSQLLAGSYGTVSNLNNGKYTYPFYFRLPMNLPSSFRGSRGVIKFYASGHVEFQGKNLFADNIIKSFDVVAPFDLNNGNADVREPIELEFEEVFSCGCFGGNPVSVRLRVPFSAYCPGQVIPVAVQVDNNSSVEISGMTFELLSRSRYKSQHPIAEYVQPEEVLACAKRGSIMSGNTRNFEVELKVPDFIAPNLELCNVIDVGYFLRVTIKVSGCNEDLQDEAELCLGLVPLRETVSGTYTHPMSHSLPLDTPPGDHPPDVTQKLTVTNAPGIGFVQDVSYVGENQVKTYSSQSHQIGFTTGNATDPPAYSPGNTGQWPNPYGIQMKCFTATGVYPHPGQNNAPVLAPSAPPL